MKLWRLKLWHRFFTTTRENGEAARESLATATQSLQPARPAPAHQPGESTLPEQLAFGATDFVDILTGRINEHFTNPSHRDGDPSLVVGLFGEWGSGKTILLRALESRFELQPPLAPEVTKITLPIFFNAWRYEAEPHLIIPLLKTAQHVILDWRERHKGVAQEASEWLLERAKMLSQSTIALAYGIKGELSLPLVGNVQFEPGKMLDEEKKRWQEVKNGKKSSIDELSSIYYDFHEYMLKLTGRKPEIDGPELNLLFLIDDLDRCLPEKVVEMLESIKLILEVRGCAFVLAVDDEVVMRGIAHRYKDYSIPAHTAFDGVAYSLDPERFRTFQEDRGQLPEQPITGNEYLEKIIHLPFRIPLPTVADIEAFLTKRYPELFASEEARKLGQETGSSEERVGAREKAEEPEGEAAKKRALLTLFLQGVPPVPRKLIRTAELLKLLLAIASARGWTAIDELTLARLVCLQLFAPALYRFGKRQPGFLATIENWSRSPLWKTAGYLERDIEQRLGETDKIEDEEERFERLFPIQSREKPLLHLIKETSRARGGFDPRNLVLEGWSSDQNLRDYYELLSEAETVTVRREAAELRTGKPEDVVGFLAQVVSDDPIAWRNALEQEARRLESRVLDDQTFAALLERLKRRPKVVTLDWVETMCPYFSQDQLKTTYKESSLLKRLYSDMR